MKRVFKAGVSYMIDLEVCMGNILQTKLYESLRTDGRKLGNFAELILLSEFGNIVSSPNGNSKFNLLELPKVGGARSWEVKTAAKGKPADFSASNMKGVGRAFNPEEHEARMGNLTGYIVFDVSLCPRVMFKGFEVATLVELGCSKRMSRRIMNRELLIGLDTGGRACPPLRLVGKKAA